MKIGIAFAGGGVRGAAHLGVLQALEEVGIKADYYAGTSAGSIIATMKAIGKTNEECLEMMKDADKSLIDIAYWDIVKNVPSKLKHLDSVLKGDKLKRYLLKHIGPTFLMSLEYGLGIVSTDINTGTQVVFTSEYIDKNELSKIDDMVKCYGRYTPLYLPNLVYSSCALPGIFRPLTYNGMKLVDGSLTNNLPANILKLMGAEKIISIDLSKRNPSTYQVSGIANILSQTVSVLVDQIEYLSLSKVEDVIKMSVDVTDIGLLDFNQIQECYEKGYEYGKSIASFVKSNIEG